LLFAALLAGCTQSDEASERVAASFPEGVDSRKGYLTQASLPDSVALLPPPPAEGSAALARDEEIAANNIALRNSARWALAVADANLRFPQAADTFACALDMPITEADSPRTYTLLRRTLSDAGRSTAAAKKYYARPRPFLINNEPICTPDEIAGYRNSGAYPSGHAAVGWAWALILAELVPEQSEAILARGLAFGNSRAVCNIHWQSDVEQGRVMAAATVARLHAEPDFRADMDAARDELGAVRNSQRKPTRDCAAERAALLEDS
jgi:acid phosphatase (class A)